MGRIVFISPGVKTPSSGISPSVIITTRYIIEHIKASYIRQGFVRGLDT